MTATSLDPADNSVISDLSAGREPADSRVRRSVVIFASRFQIPQMTDFTGLDNQPYPCEELTL